MPSQSSRENLPSLSFLGAVVALPNGPLTVYQPVWESPHGPVLFQGKVTIDPQLVRPQIGLRVRISGPFQCAIALRNPGRVEDGLLEIKEPRLSGFGKKFRVRLLSEADPYLVRIPKAFYRGLKRTFGEAPQLLGFLEAVWTGDDKGLPLSLREFFKEGGVLQILALSGQHVTAMVLIVTLLTRLGLTGFFRLVGVRGERYLGYVYQSLPIACCTLLLVTSQGSGSVVRTFGMYFALWLLRVRRMQCPPVQLAASSVACMIIWDPGLIAGAGFFLSAVATALTCQVLAEQKIRRQLLEFLFVVTAMPILVVPLSAFFFAKGAWFAPLYNLILGWLWDLLLIPVGFLLPILFAISPAPLTKFLLPHLERSWIFIVEKHFLLESWIGTAYQSCVRPTWAEFLVLELLLLGVVMRLKRRLIIAEG